MRSDSQEGPAGCTNGPLRNGGRRCPTCGSYGYKPNGTKGGRPRKNLTAAEIGLMVRLDSQGESLRAIADRLNEDRGVFDVPDLSARKRRAVSHALVGKMLKEIRQNEG